MTKSLYGADLRATHFEESSYTLANLWYLLVKPLLWGIGSSTFLAVYIPTLVKTYWDGSRSFENTILKAGEKTAEQFAMLFSGDFSNHYLLGVLAIGIAVSFFVTFLFSEQQQG